MVNQAQEASVLFALEAHKEISIQQHLDLISGDDMFYEDESSIKISQEDVYVKIECQVDSQEKAHLILKALHKALVSFNEKNESDQENK